MTAEQSTLFVCLNEFGVCVRPILFPTVFPPVRSQHPWMQCKAWTTTGCSSIVCISVVLLHVHHQQYNQGKAMLSMPAQYIKSLHYD